MKISLSHYLPENTVYFYCLPAGEDSNFFNLVEAWRDEIAAMRPLVCAGEGIKIVCFPSNVETSVWNLLCNEIGAPLGNQENILVLPVEFTPDCANAERNHLVKKALVSLTAPGQLIMTQPYIDPVLQDRYQIPAERVNWLNDKKNMPEFIDAEFLPKRFASFESGADFAKNVHTLSLPCVIKVSSSSAGDGVMVSHTPADLELAKEKFSQIHGSVFVEEYVIPVKNLCVHCAIPFDSKMPIEIIGVSEQLTTLAGEFLGGVVDIQKKHSEMANIEKVLVTNILQKVRDLGWYGPCGLDVLVAPDGSFCIIDCNFRLNATSPYLYQIRNEQVHHSMITFTGVFHGDEESFKKQIVPLAQVGGSQQILNMITLMRKGDTYRFNAGLFFDNDLSKAKNALRLLDSGVDAQVLRNLPGTHTLAESL